MMHISRNDKGGNMTDAAISWRVTVVASDGLRRERLTRDLRQALCRVVGVDAGFVDGDRRHAEGDKGAVDPELVLWAGVSATTVNAAARVLIATIKEWCGQDRHRTVQLELEGRSLLLTGKPDDRQVRLVELFTEQLGVESADDSEDEAR
ncbi:hypothetical protein [Nocardia sp. NPDC046763]|uniref:hypothetical protein n=1 Tax=Nocardia sp. NPDC046763 TaxID=3155256 RepID=UPI003405EA48